MWMRPAYRKLLSCVVTAVISLAATWLLTPRNTEPLLFLVYWAVAIAGIHVTLGPLVAMLSSAIFGVALLALISTRSHPGPTRLSRPSAKL